MQVNVTRPAATSASLKPISAAIGGPGNSPAEIYCSNSRPLNVRIVSNGVTPTASLFSITVSSGTGIPF